MQYYIFDHRPEINLNQSLTSKIKQTIKQKGLEGESKIVLDKTDLISTVHAAIERQIKTLVAVGDDTTFELIAQVIAKSPKQKIAIAYIPTIGRSRLAQHLGIRSYKDAISAVTTRRLQDLQIIPIGNTVLLFEKKLRALAQDVVEMIRLEIQVEGAFQVVADAQEILLRNIAMESQNHGKLVELSLLASQTQHPSGILSENLAKLAKSQHVSGLQRIAHLAVKEAKIHSSRVITDNLGNDLAAGFAITPQTKTISIIVPKKQEGFSYL